MQKNINIKNKKARFEYEILDKYIAGIQLTGTEIKSIYDIAKKSKSDIKPINKPAWVPDDISMNINKINNKLK